MTLIINRNPTKEELDREAKEFETRLIKRTPEEQKQYEKDIKDGKYFYDPRELEDDE